MFKAFNQSRARTGAIQPSEAANRSAPVAAPKAESVTPALPKVERVKAPAAAPMPKITPTHTLARPIDPNMALKSTLHELLLDKLNLTMLDKVSREDLHREISGLVAEHLKSEGTLMPSEAFKQLIHELLNEVLGLGPLEPLLADPTISDILVNGMDKVFVERRGLLERTDVSFRDERHLLRIIDKIVSTVGRRIDESQPWVDARLEDGSRVNAIIRPCAIDGPSLSIRKFSKTPLRMEKLLEHGALSRQAALFLEAAVKGRMNCLISGGTGSGKTTMLNAMSALSIRASAWSPSKTPQNYSYSKSTLSAWKHAPPTRKAKARSPSATYWLTPCACAPTASW